ncbi:hypothetical protein RJ55_03808 [Drechmeria coniospora]|nr:hypothetical protein RJ55_03808 [Drechmeria coniospora]
MSPRGRRLVGGLMASGLILFFVAAVPRLMALSLIFGPHAGVAMTQKQVVDDHQATLSLPVARPRPVPRIIHQIAHDWISPANETVPMPLAWVKARRNCVALHPTWEHKLWDEAVSRQFIRYEYPWFLQAYDDLPSPSKRSEVLRYFLLRHFGGIYLHLDHACHANLEPLLYYPTWVVDTGRGALSNAIMASEPEHPFWITVTDSVTAWTGKPLLPYGANYSTGAWYETKIWELYHARASKTQPPKPSLHRIVVDDAHSELFIPGNSTWGHPHHTALEWVGSHPFQTIYFALLALGFLVVAALSLGHWAVQHERQQKGYGLLV